MNEPSSPAEPITPPKVQEDEAASADTICPVCGAKLVQEKCKVVCRSERCRYRIVLTCAEF